MPSRIGECGALYRDAVAWHRCALWPAHSGAHSVETVDPYRRHDAYVGAHTTSQHDTPPNDNTRRGQSRRVLF